MQEERAMTNLYSDENKENNKIKSFLYLDTEKMYSISSQIFAGLTEYALKAKHNSTKEEETQKGPLGSGQILADIITESSSITEKHFLHDYSYNLFEEALITKGKVLELNASNVVDSIADINNKSFVKITGKVLFSDISRIIRSIKNYNDFGYSVWYITQGKSLVESYKELKSEANKIVDRNKKAAAINKIDGQVNFKKELEEASLRMDPEYLEQMVYALDYGYSGQLEIQTPMFLNEDNYLFSALLKREMLKESEEFIIKKYSVKTEREFTVFGIPTQTKGEQEKLNTKLEVDDPTIKQVMTNIVSSFSEIESSFTGKLDYEYVIDPIAVYLEI